MVALTKEVTITSSIIGTSGFRCAADGVLPSETAGAKAEAATEAAPAGDAGGAAAAAAAAAAAGSVCVAGVVQARRCENCGSSGIADAMNRRRPVTGTGHPWVITTLLSPHPANYSPNYMYQRVLLVEILAAATFA